MNDDIEINLDDPEDINIAVDDDDSPISVEMPEGGMDGRSIHPAGEWSDAVEYAYLDLVTHEGSSYTAVRAVPAGTELTDTYYWQLTAEKGDPGDPGTPEWGAITGDLSDQTDLADALDGKAPVILSSASGSIASFSDGSPAPVTALSVSIDPVQDLHGYDNPWSAGGGVNLLPTLTQEQSVSQNGLTVTYKTNGAIVISGQLNSGTSFFNNFALPLSVDVDTSLFIQYLNSLTSSNVSVGFRNSNNTSITASTLDNNNKIVQFTGSGTVVQVSVFINSTAQFTNFTLYPMITKNNSPVASYSPYSNICPISGHTSATVTRTGKNVLDTKNTTWKKFYINNNVFTVLSDSSTVVSYTINNDYSISASNSSTYRGIGFNISAVDYDRVISISDTESGNNGLRLYSSYTTGASSIRTTTSTSLPIYAGESGFLCVLFKTSGSHEFTLQLELSSSASAYEPYQGTSVTIDLDGTRYGGTLNVLTGEMVVDRAYLSFDGSSDESWAISTGMDSSIHRLSTFLSGIKRTDNNTSAEIICNIYTSKSANNTYRGQIGISVQGNSETCYICDNYTSINDWRAYLSVNNLQVCYKLATPFTVQLSENQISTLLGQNNLWADTGDVAVEYRADTKLYIEKLTKPAEDDMTANTNISANTFFMVGNSLYYATSAIATGTTIVPGQNCTALSLAEALNNINA